MNGLWTDEEVNRLMDEWMDNGDVNRLMNEWMVDRWRDKEIANECIDTTHEEDTWQTGGIPKYPSIHLSHVRPVINSPHGHCPFSSQMESSGQPHAVK